jgi:hypothetical protein
MLARATGPVTDEGKARSSANALRHGLAARRFLLLPDEDPAELERHCLTLQDEWRPISAAEHRLVRQIAIGEWRLGRALDLEARLHSDESLDAPARARLLTTYSRYTRSIERSIAEAKRGLQQSQAAREPEPAPPPRPTPARLPAPPPAQAAEPARPLNRAQRRLNERLARMRAKAA